MYAKFTFDAMFVVVVVVFLGVTALLVVFFTAPWRALAS